MKFSKLGLLTLLISLFILNSCKRQEGIGLGVDPENQLNGSLISDTSFTVSTVPDDTVSTTGLAKTPLSYFNDPELGITEANMVAQLTLPSGSTFTLPTGTITIDSVRLVLPYAPTGFYGDSLTSKFKVDVHQLNEKFQLSTTYFNNKQWNYNSALLGTKTFTARSHDTIKVYNIIPGKPDTLVKAPPQIRVPIDPEFINNYLIEAPAVNRNSTIAFQNAIKGLYITLDKSGTTGPGGNIMFSLDSASVNVYYRATNGTTVDTAIINLPVPAAAHAAQIKHTYSAKVQAALNNPASSSLVYLQGLSGLRAKVSFPNLKTVLGDNVNNVVINRAEVVVTPAPGSTIPYGPLLRLTMYQYDIAKQRIRLQDAATSDPRGQHAVDYFGGYYNPNTNEYHFLITAYIQDLYRGKTVDYGTFIAPVDPTPPDQTGIKISNTAQYAERVITPGKNSPNRIKLNIIYTKINK